MSALFRSLFSTLRGGGGGAFFATSAALVAITLADRLVADEEALIGVMASVLMSLRARAETNMSVLEQMPAPRRAMTRESVRVIPW